MSSKCGFYTCPVHVMRHYNFSFCFMHKVASTTFQSHLVKLAGFRDLNKSRIQFHGHHLPRHSIRSLVLPPYVYNYKFMFVRHPFSRLLSAYYAKLVIECMDVEEDKMGPLCPIANQIVSKYRQNDNKGPVTFREFVWFLLDTVDQPYDSHWTRMWRVCQPCTVHFDFIGKIETSYEDLSYIYKHLDIDKVIGKNVSAILNKSESRRLVSECFSQLDEETFYKLYEVYKEDFIMFDYSMEEFLQYVRK